MQKFRFGNVLSCVSKIGGTVVSGFLALLIRSAPRFWCLLCWKQFPPHSLEVWGAASLLILVCSFTALFLDMVLSLYFGLSAVYLFQCETALFSFWKIVWKHFFDNVFPLFPKVCPSGPQIIQMLGHPATSSHPHFITFLFLFPLLHLCIFLFFGDLLNFIFHILVDYIYLHVLFKYWVVVSI